MIALISDFFFESYNYGHGVGTVELDRRKRNDIYSCRHACFNFYAQKCFRKNTPTSGRGERWEDGEGGKGQGVIYIGPIYSSERAPYVAFSQRVTYGNVGRAKQFCSPAVRGGATVLKVGGQFRKRSERKKFFFTPPPFPYLGGGGKFSITHMLDVCFVLDFAYFEWLIITVWYHFVELFNTDQTYYFTNNCTHGERPCASGTWPV